MASLEMTELSTNMASLETLELVELHFELEIDPIHAFQSEQITTCIAEVLKINKNDVYFDGVEEIIKDDKEYALFRGRIPTTNHEIENLVSIFYDSVENNALKQKLMQHSDVSGKLTIRIRELYETDPGNGQLCMDDNQYINDEYHDDEPQMGSNITTHPIQQSPFLPIQYNTIQQSPIIQAPPPSPLIGSQQQTFQTLISMGFDRSESITVATIFGSNIEGAIRCVLGDGIDNINVSNNVPRNAWHSLFPTAPLQNPSIIPMKEEQVMQFRRTSLSETLMTGYSRNYNIPTVIKDIIIAYFNLYFIKLNYNIHNDPATDAFHNGQAILVLRKNQTLREIAIKLEKSYKYSYNELMDRNQYFSHYQYFVHLWIKFGNIKTIYPIKNSKITITMDHINKYQSDDDGDRWVEIPNDFEQVKINDIDMLMDRVKPNDVLELGIETFDQWSNRWAFRDNTSVPIDEIVRSDVFSINPFSPRPVGMSPFRYKHSKQSVLHFDDEERVIAKIRSNSMTTPLKRDRNDKKRAKKTRANSFSFDVDSFDFRPYDMITQRGSDSDQEHDKSDTFAYVQDMMGSIHTLTPRTLVDNDEHQHNNDASKEEHYSTLEYDDMTLPETTPVPVPAINDGKDWKCVHCRQRNDKTYVICSRCFKEKEIVEVPSLPKACIEWIKHLKIGDIVDVRDEQEKWYEAVIRYIEVNNNNTLLYIHYIGWNRKWDEKLSAENVQRIAKRNTWTKGPHRHSTSPSNAYPNYKHELDLLNNIE